MASQVYTLPTTVSTTTWQRLQVSVDTVAISFKNDSRYDWILVFGGQNAPRFTSSAGGQANAYINALEYPTIWVQAPGVSSYERARNATLSFDGNIWYLAIDNTSGLAITGVFSNRVVVNIVTYGPYDAAPVSGLAVSRQTDITNQARFVTLPMAVNQQFSTTVTTPANADSSLPGGVQLISTGVSVGIGPTVTRVNVYLYNLQVEPLVWGAAQGHFLMWFYDSTPTPLATGINIYYAWEVACSGRNGARKGTEITFPNPVVATVGVPATAATLRTAYTFDSGDGGMSLRISGQVSVDQRNFNPPGPYGTYAATTPGDLY